MAVQRNLSKETTAMRDHCLRYSRQKALHFNITEPVIKDYLSWETTHFYDPWGGLSRQALLYKYMHTEPYILPEMIIYVKTVLSLLEYMAYYQYNNSSNFSKCFIQKHLKHKVSKTRKIL